jgi:hypothetical protein
MLSFAGVIGLNSKQSASKKKGSVFPRDKTRGIVFERMERFRKAYKGPMNRWKTDFFNNIYANFPTGYRRLNSDEQMLNKKRPELKGKTMKEFFADVDLAIKRAGVSTKALERLVKERDAAELAIVSLPIYIELTKMGYSHWQIVLG